MRSRFWFTCFTALFALLSLPACFALELGIAQWGRGKGSGVILYRQQGQTYALDLNRGQVEALGPPRVSSFAVSPNGERIAFILGDEIFVAPLWAVNQMRQLTHNNVEESGLAWSPDGAQLAYWSMRDGGHVGELLIATVDNGQFRSLGSFARQLSRLAWSPDGDQFAFSSRQDDDDEIYLIDVQSVEARQLTRNNFRDSSPAWSPDGQRLVFTSIEDGYNELHVINVATGERVQLTRSVIGYLPSWSPDGRHIAFMSNRDGSNEIYVANADGMKLRRLTYFASRSYDDLEPVWLP
jgi:Tol biopolymer transport system component